MTGGALTKGTEAEHLAGKADSPMLTHQQLHLLNYLESYHGSHGIMPSMDEMRVALDLRSKSGIPRLLRGLEERGTIRRLERRARAIEIIRGASAMRREQRPRPDTGAGGPSAVPLVGTVSSGSPPLVLEGRFPMADVPGGLLGPGDHFAGAGILSGDVAILRRQTDAALNDIVLVAVDETEALLRRFVPRGPSLGLMAADPRSMDRIVRRDRVHVQGRLAGILRDYR
jgi:repressor LexA